MKTLLIPIVVVLGLMPIALVAGLVYGLAYFIMLCQFLSELFYERVLDVLSWLMDRMADIVDYIVGRTSP